MLAKRPAAAAACTRTSTTSEPCTLKLQCGTYIRSNRGATPFWFKVLLYVLSVVEPCQGSHDPQAAHAQTSTFLSEKGRPSFRGWQRPHERSRQYGSALLTRTVVMLRMICSVYEMRYCERDFSEMKSDTRQAVNILADKTAHQYFLPHPDSHEQVVRPQRQQLVVYTHPQPCARLACSHTKQKGDSQSASARTHVINRFVWVLQAVLVFRVAASRVTIFTSIWLSPRVSRCDSRRHARADVN